MLWLGVIAQLVEHLNGIEGASGSSPLNSILIGTKLSPFVGTKSSMILVSSK